MADSIDDMLRKKQLAQGMTNVIPPANPIGLFESNPQAYTRLTRTPIHMKNVDDFNLGDWLMSPGFGALDKSMPLMFDPSGKKKVPEATGMTDDLGQRIQVNYNPKVSPWEIMSTILHEDVHAALGRGLGGEDPPSLRARSAPEYSSLEQTEARTGFKRGNPAEAPYPKGRAGEWRAELPAYVLASPWDLGGIMSQKDRDAYVSQMAEELNKRKRGLGDLYLRMYRSAGGDVENPTPKWARDK